MLACVLRQHQCWRSSSKCNSICRAGKHAFIAGVADDQVGNPDEHSPCFLPDNSLAVLYCCVEQQINMLCAHCWSRHRACTPKRLTASEAALQGFGWAIAKALAEAGAEISLGVWVCTLAASDLQSLHCLAEAQVLRLLPARCRL